MSEWLDGMLGEVMNPNGDFFFKQASAKNMQEVYRYLEKTYPTDTLEWVDDAIWTKKKVSLEDIKMDRRPGGAREVEKVKNIAEAFKKKEKMEPVVLVKTPEGKLKVADGYHRTLGCKHAENKEIEAWVGTVEESNGPWDKEMHEKKLNKGKMEKVAIAPIVGMAGKLGAGLLKSTGKSLKNFGTGVTFAGTKGAKQNIAQIKSAPTVDKTALKGAKKDLRGLRTNQAKAYGTLGIAAAGYGINEAAKSANLQNEQDQQAMKPPQMKF